MYVSIYLFLTLLLALAQYTGMFVAAYISFFPEIYYRTVEGNVKIAFNIKESYGGICFFLRCSVTKLQYFFCIRGEM